MTPEVEIEISEPAIHDAAWHLNNLEKLRFDYSDELPNYEVKDGDPDHFKYKGSAAYIGMVRLGLQRAIHQGFFSPVLVEQVSDFLKYDFSTNSGNRTSKAEVEYMNLVLDSAVDDLKKHLVEG